MIPGCVLTYRAARIGAAVVVQLSSVGYRRILCDSSQTANTMQARRCPASSSILSAMGVEACVETRQSSLLALRFACRPLRCVPSRASGWHGEVLWTCLSGRFAGASLAFTATLSQSTPREYVTVPELEGFSWY